MSAPRIQGEGQKDGWRKDDQMKMLCTNFTSRLTESSARVVNLNGEPKRYLIDARWPRLSRDESKQCGSTARFAQIGSDAPTTIAASSLALDWPSGESLALHLLCSSPPQIPQEENHEIFLPRRAADGQPPRCRNRRPSSSNQRPLDSKRTRSSPALSRRSASGALCPNRSRPTRSGGAVKSPPICHAALVISEHRLLLNSYLPSRSRRRKPLR